MGAIGNLLMLMLGWSGKSIRLRAWAARRNWAEARKRIGKYIDRLLSSDEDELQNPVKEDVMLISARFGC